MVNVSFTLESAVPLIDSVLGGLVQSGVTTEGAFQKNANITTATTISTA